MKWLVALIILASGCLSQTITEKFVCSDGWVADSPDGCVGHTPPCPNCTCKAPACPKCESVAKIVYVNVSSLPSADASCASLGCPPGTEYVSSKSSGKYHACGCRFAEALSKKNLICYPSAEEAQAAGKLPCGICAVSL
ncbi:MAG: hypothetical protein V1875_01035 [Candidatus Altiarchaeota archaeon]